MDSYPPEVVPRGKLLRAFDVRSYVDWNEVAALTAVASDLNTFEDKVVLLQCSQMLQKAYVEVGRTDVYLARMEQHLLTELSILNDELRSKTETVRAWTRGGTSSLCIYERSGEYHCARGVCSLLRHDIIVLQKSLQRLRECVQQVSYFRC